MMYLCYLCNLRWCRLEKNIKFLIFLLIHGWSVYLLFTSLGIFLHYVCIFWFEILIDSGQNNEHRGCRG